MEADYVVLHEVPAVDHKPERYFRCSQLQKAGPYVEAGSYRTVVEARHSYMSVAGRMFRELANLTQGEAKVAAAVVVVAAAAGSRSDTREVLGAEEVEPTD